MVAIIDIHPTLPAFPAIGMIMTLLLDALGSGGGHILGPIFGYLAGGGIGGPWPGHARGDIGSAAMAAIALLPLLVVEFLLLAGFAAVSARRRQHPDQTSRRPHDTLPTASLDCRQGTCAR